MEQSSKKMGRLAKVSELENWKDNPRLIDKEDLHRLKEQIKRFGQYKPLMVLCPDNVVLGGNMRLRALRELGQDEVWVSDIELTQDTNGVWRASVNGTPIETEWLTKGAAMLEFALSDNDRAGSYDDEKLAEQLWAHEITLPLFKVDLGKMTTVEELKERFGPEPDEDDVPDLEPGKPANSQQGVVYQLGPHRLMCGDSRSGGDVGKLMGGVKADMVFTDPPYNVDYTGGTGAKRKKIANDNLGSEFYDFLYDVMVNLINHTQGAFYVCMSSSELHSLWRAFTEAGGHWSTYIIWAKNAFTLSRSDHHRQYEPIMYGLTQQQQEQVTEAAEGDDALPILYGWNKHHWYGGRKQGDVWYYDRPTRSADHPTQKPVALCARAIRNSTRPGELVLDLFGGSGSTLIAAEETGRICNMMEFDPHYCDVIRKRYAAMTGAEDWEEATPMVKS